MSDGVEIMRITITRRLTEDDDVVSITCSEDLSFFDGLGLLAQAMHTWGETNGLKEGGAMSDPG
jgi:hypothetical protein